MTGSRWIRLSAVAGALVFCAPALATEERSDAPRSCYDAQVLARIVRQAPSEMIDCGADCIVMSWPWFVELDVEHVARGGAPTGRLKVLTIQHADMRSDRSLRFWLRRNDLGGFNVVRDIDDTRPRRCSRQDGRAEAYIRPGPHQTLGELQAEAARAYGRRD